jgi:hypothetical protein
MSNTKYFGVAVAGMVPSAAKIDGFVAGGNTFGDMAIDAFTNGIRRAVEMGKADPSAITVEGLKRDTSRRPSVKFNEIQEGGFGDRKVILPGQKPYKPVDWNLTH